MLKILSFNVLLALVYKRLTSFAEMLLQALLLQLFNFVNIRHWNVSNDQYSDATKNKFKINVKRHIEKLYWKSDSYF